MGKIIYSIVYISILSFFLVQNVSAALIGETGTLEENNSFEGDGWINNFLTDANQVGFYNLAEVVKSLKKNDKKAALIFLEKAKSSFLIALEQNRNSASYKGLVKISILEQDYKQAAKWLEGAEKIDKDDLGTLYLKAKLLIIKNYLAEANSLLQQIVEKNKNYKLAYYSLAEIAIKQKKYSLAEKYYKQLLGLRVQNATVYMNLAGLYAVQKKHEQAVAILLQGYENFKNSPSDRVNLASDLVKQYVSNNSLEDALHLSQSLFDDYPNNIRVLNLYLDTLVMNNKQAEAEALLVARIAKNDKDTDSRLKLIVLLSKNTENTLKVVQLYEKVISLNKNIPEAYIRYLRYLIKNRLYSEANVVIVKAREQFPSSNIADILMADFLASKNDLDGAAKYYLTAYKKGNNNNLLVKLVQSLMVSKQKPAAIKLLKKEIKTSQSTTARMLLAGIYLTAKNLDSAEYQYREVLAKNPDHYIALNDLAWLLSQQNKDKEALPLAEKAYYMEPNSDEIKNTYTTILKHLGFDDKAREVEEK